MLANLTAEWRTEIVGVTVRTACGSGAGGHAAARREGPVAKPQHSKSDSDADYGFHRC